MNQIEVRAEILLTSELLSADEIVAATGLSADRSWARGDVVSPKGGVPEKQNGVSISSARPATDRLQEHAENLLERAAPHAERIRGLRDVDVELAFAHDVEERIPIDLAGSGADFSPPSARFLGSIRILDVDLEHARGE